MLRTITFFILFIPSTFAEYRAYQYLVKSLFTGKNTPSAPKSFVVTSTLDPTSYVKYYGGINRIEIVPLRSWMCPGDTSGFKPICPSPYSQSIEPTKIK